LSIDQRTKRFDKAFDDAREMARRRMKMKYPELRKSANQ
jgi:hypothetical protein